MNCIFIVRIIVFFYEAIRCNFLNLIKQKKNEKKYFFYKYMKVRKKEYKYLKNTQNLKKSLRKIILFLINC